MKSGHPAPISDEPSAEYWIEDDYDGEVVGLGTFLTFDFDTPARVSYDNKTYILVSLLEEDSSLFEHELSTYVDNEELYFCLEYCGVQQWNEGILICEREIAKRELNKESVVVERFEL